MTLKFKYVFTMLAVVFGMNCFAQGNGSKLGTVTEQIDASTYTYLNVRTEAGEQWIAIQKRDVSVGDSIEFSGGVPMTDFYSQSLDRTFESILFVSNVTVESNVPGNTEEFESFHSTATPMSRVPVEEPEKPEIAPLDGGMTVGELLQNASDLSGETVSLRAKVTKVNANIMGKTWVTLQDGSGEAPEDKILATTNQMVEPGDVVVASGTVATEVDLGYGYIYDVLLEDASFRVE